MEQTNPFITFNRDALQVPNFPKNTKFIITISEEAATNLKTILQRRGITMSNKGLSKLIEAIGLFTITLTENPTEIDPESGVTVEDCRQAGYSDAIEGNPQRFLMLFGKTNNVFQDQYLRGYLEGNFIKNGGK